VSSEEEKNKALARRFVGAFASGDMDTPEELMAPQRRDRDLFEHPHPPHSGGQDHRRVERGKPTRDATASY
jgi:hypothetical protein